MRFSSIQQPMTLRSRSTWARSCGKGSPCRQRQHWQPNEIDASDGAQRIMDIQPRELHMRSPLFIGSKHMVERIESLLAKEQIKVQ